MTFIFNDTIPAAANSPSVDQPVMLANNVSDQGIWAVDHIGFNVPNGGTHLQMHLPQYTSPSVINGSATQGSVVYSAAGVADAAHAQLYFENPNVTLQLSAIRAWGYASGTVASPTNSIINNQQVNVVSVVRTSTGVYTVTLDANTLSSSDYAVFISPYSAVVSTSIVYNISITSSTVFVVTFRQPSNGTVINVNFFAFQVLQI